MSFNWSEDSETIIVTALGQVPYVGVLLAALAEVFWPQQHEDVWGEIKDQVEQLVDAKISEEVYYHVEAVLGSADQGTGLIGVLDNYLGAVDGSNGEDPKATWHAANTVFIGDSGAFQQRGSEVLLLPLFAQMVNLHLNLLRDGILQNFVSPMELQQKILLYTKWATQWTAQGLADRKSKYTNQFNPINIFTRFMQLNVLNFVRLWQYMDPTLYSQGIPTLPPGPEIFYSVSEYVPYLKSAPKWAINYNVPGTRAGNVNGINVYSLRSNQGNYVMLTGWKVGYDMGMGITGYTGATTNPNQPYGTTPVLNKDIYSVGIYSLTNLAVGLGSRSIFRIDAMWSYDSYIKWMQFTFRDLSCTNTIPANIDNNGNSKSRVEIIAPSGYRLSSIWAPNKRAFYDATTDAVFGFQDSIQTIDDTPRIAFDPQQWAENTPVAGSTNWVTGYSIQYAFAWIYNDDKVGNLGPWCDSVAGGPWSMPMLLLPTATDSGIKSRKIYRKFANNVVEHVATIEATIVRYQDTKY